jgi:hypothetical protein
MTALAPDVAIRGYLNVKPYNQDAQEVLDRSIRDAAQIKEELADLINVGIEELIRQRFELPGFTTLRPCAQRGRAAVNHEIYQRVAAALGAEGRTQLDHLLIVDQATGHPLWTTIKDDPGKPTLTQLRQLVARLKWLTTYNGGASALAVAPPVKVQHFAAEAQSLDAARMQRMTPAKRSTLAAALVKAHVAQTLDDLGEMFLKRMRSIHHHGEDALDDYRRRQQGRTDELMTILYELLTAMQQDAPPEARLAGMSAVVGDQTNAILADCLAFTAYAHHNYYPLLSPFYTSHRHTLFALLDQMPLRSTSQDTTVEAALACLRMHRTSKRNWLDLSATPLDLSWVPDKWWTLVTGTTVRTRAPRQVNRRHFEVCLFSQVIAELKSGDLRIEGSEQFADYREQLIAEQLEPVNILNVLTDTDNWLQWTRFFGLLSGRDARIEEARARYVATTFCYGCNLGPTQTAQSLGIFDRRQLAWIDLRHITEDRLDAAITALINAYNQFALPKFWGSGKSASADGMKWDLYEQNLLAEYHIRYGGYGRIGPRRADGVPVAVSDRCGPAADDSSGHE